MQVIHRPLNDVTHWLLCSFPFHLLWIRLLILSVDLVQVKQAPNQKYALALVLASWLANPNLVFCKIKINKFAQNCSQ